MRELKIIGYVGYDPTIRPDNNGKSFTTFSVGVKGSATEEWVQVSCNGKLGEMIAKNLKKGELVYCSGKNKVSVWHDEKAGEYKPIEYLYLDKFEFLSGKKDIQPIIDEKNEDDIPL